MVFISVLVSFVAEFIKRSPSLRCYCCSKTFVLISTSEGRPLSELLIDGIDMSCETPS